MTETVTIGMRQSVAAAGERGEGMLIYHHITTRFRTNMTSSPSSSPYPTKAIREACWRERDNLWKCLDDNNDDESKCKEMRKAVIASCPDQWVSHYDRRRKYLQFKDKIEKGGYDPVEEYTKAHKNDPQDK